MSATGGVVIGLMLACFVIAGGFTLVPAADVSAEYASHPTRVDERIDGGAPYPYGIAIDVESSRPIVVAKATVAAD